MAASAVATAMPADVSVVARNVLLLLQTRLSTDNQVRRDAEGRLVSIREETPDTFALAVLMIMRQEVDVDSRQSAAVHLKLLLKEDILKTMLAGKDDAASPEGLALSLWGQLNPTTRQHIKTECLGCLESGEPSKPVRNAICDTVIILGGRLLSEGAWPELQPKIFALLGADDSKLQVSGLQLLSGLFGDLTHADKSVLNNMQIIHHVLLKLMPSPSADVRFECVSLIASIVEMEKRSTWKHLQASVPDILVCVQLAAEVDENELRRVLTLLIDIAQYDAGFFSQHLPALTTAIFTLARNPQATDEIKQLTIEVILTMCEGKPKMCMKSAGLIDNTLNVLMEFLVSIEEDPEWEGQDFDDGDDLGEETEAFNVAEGGLDRVAASIGGEHVLPKLFGLAVQYLQQSQWKMKFAALVAIAQTVEHIPEEEVEKYLEKLVPICLQQLRDPHPRVRHAACRALGQAATDTSPIMQENHVHAVLPALMERLEDPIIRNQSHAARALSNYLEAVRKEDATVYANTLIERLLSLCTLNRPKPLLAASVTCLAVVASIVENVFVPYQDRVVSEMKQIVNTLSEESDRFVREKALECISLVALAVGKDAFQVHSAECMSAIVQLWSSSIDAQVANPDGSLTGEGPSETLNETLCRMCRVMGVEFVEHLPAIMPRIFKILGQRPRPANIETINAEELSDLCVVGVVNGKTMGLTSAVILDLEQMTTLLYTCATALGAAFEKWIVETVNQSLPLLEFQYCEKIMQNVLNLLAAAVQVGRQFADREQEPAIKAGYMQLLSRWTWQGVQSAIDAVEDDHLLAETTLDIPSCAANLIKHAGSDMLIAEHVFTLTKQCVTLIKQCIARNTEAGEARKEEHDEDEEDDIQGEQRYELELAAGMVEIIGAVIQHHSKQFVQTGSSLCLEFIQKELAAAATEPNKAVGSDIRLHIALYLITELINLGEEFSQIWAPFQGTLLDGLSSADPSIQQSASHGLKVILKQTKVMTPEMVVTVASALLAVLEKLDKLTYPFEESVQGAYDNIVAALGAVMFQQTEIITACGNPILSPSSLLQVWLSHLPIKSDESEAQVVHGELVELILNENEEVIGPNMSNMPHLIKIFAFIYQLPMSTPEIDEKIVKIMQAIGDAVTTMGIQLESTVVQRNLERLIQDSKNASVAQQQAAALQQ
eukprot:Lankesteria_metandrocarpae@DN3945_c0_g1_i1.p1